MNRSRYTVLLYLSRVDRDGKKKTDVARRGGF